MSSKEPQTEQAWLGNEPQTGSNGMTISGILQKHGYPQPVTLEQVATPAQIRAIEEAEAIRGMRRALKPFPRHDGAYPRAGIRRRVDGRYQVRLWLEPGLPDSVQGGACDTLADAVGFGQMIADFTRRS